MQPPRRYGDSRRRGAPGPAACWSGRRLSTRGHSRATGRCRRACLLSQTDVCASDRVIPNFHRNLLSQSCFRIAPKGNLFMKGPPPSPRRPRMPHRTLLSPEQRTRVLGIPTEAAEMAKHYVLSTEDLALVRTKRRLSNRLGFAVQLCALRHPGRPLERAEVPPAAMLAFVANQVGADPKFFGDYAHRAETRREHLLELQQYLRLRSFHLADWRACLNVGANAAWATDRGEPIAAIRRCGDPASPGCAAIRNRRRRPS